MKGGVRVGDGVVPREGEERDALEDEGERVGDGSM